MGINPGDFLRSFSDIKDLYLEVKEAIILAENFDKRNDVYLSPLNELRNALDHLMRSLVYPEQLNQDNSVDGAAFNPKTIQLWAVKFLFIL
jgi:hypothetical protein